MNCGNNLTKAKRQAQANADTFGIPYYVVQTTFGLYVEAHEPADREHKLFTAMPSDLERE